MLPIDVPSVVIFTDERISKDFAVGPLACRCRRFLSRGSRPTRRPIRRRAKCATVLSGRKLLKPFSDIYEQFSGKVHATRGSNALGEEDYRLREWAERSAEEIRRGTGEGAERDRLTDTNVRAEARAAKGGKVNWGAERGWVGKEK